MIYKFICILFFWLFTSVVFLASATETDSTTCQNRQISEPFYTPSIVRYILDELKQEHQDQQSIRAELTDKVASARLAALDRVIRYYEQYFLYYYSRSISFSSAGLEVY